MRGHHCERNVGAKVAAFSNHLESTNQETPNLTTENVELLTKFASFLQEQKRGHMHGHFHGKHGRFEKHGHRGMLHQFGRHGPHGRSHHGHRHSHGHGRHCHGGHGGHGKHGFESGNQFEHGKHFGHQRGKHFWRHIAMCNMSYPETIVIEDSGVQRPTQSAPPQSAGIERSSEVNNVQCACDCKHRHGRRGRGHGRCNALRPVENQGPLQTPERSVQIVGTELEQARPVVENITIENSEKE